MRVDGKEVIMLKSCQFWNVNRFWFRAGLLDFKTMEIL